MDLFEKLSARRKVLAKQLSDPAAVGFWRMVVDKYSEKAHFLYELFQNADDTKATRVRLILEEKGLYFIHNGAIQFSLTDPDEEGRGKPIGHLNSITSVGASTKIKSSSIGKFGIGFKSVFQYTERPHIEDDTFCFSLNDYIVPKLDERIPGLRMAGETLFYFPFVNSEVAISEISNTIKGMDNPLLFLNNLREISWKSAVDGSDLKWQTQLLSTEICEGVDGLQLTHNFVKSQSPDSEGYFHYLWADVQHKEKGDLSACVVYGATSDGRVVPLKTGKNTFCYFHLEESLGLPFIIHAPFLLTENRELIKKDDEWNVYLFGLLAKISSSLFLISANGHLKLDTECFFDYLPSVDDADKNAAPFIEAFVETLKRYKVIKSSLGDYVDCSHTLLSQDALLPEIFSAEMLEGLNPNWKGKLWAYAFLYTKKAEERKTYIEFLLKNKLVGSSCEVEDVLPLLTTDLLAQQSDEWLSKFYILLSKHKTLFTSDLFRKSPLIKCTDGVFRPLANEYGIGQLYLKTDKSETSSFSLFFVDVLFNQPELAAFCELAGIGEPSEFTFVEKGIVANYNNNVVARDQVRQIAADLSRIAAYFSSLAFDVNAKNDLIALVSDVTFLPTVDYNGKKSFSEPDLVYFDTKELRDYFGTKEGVLFFDAEVILQTEVMMREKLYYFLQAIGVSFYPRVIEDGIIPKDADLEFYEIKPKSLRVHDNGSQHIVDKYIDGYDHFISNWSAKSSIALYRLLGKMIGECGAFAFRRQLNGIYSYYEKSKQKQTEEPVYKTTAYKQLFETDWLTSCAGNRIGLSVAKNSTDLFEDCLEKDSDVYALQLLGIRYDSTLVNLPPEHKKSILLMSRLKEAGITEEDLVALWEGKAKIEYIKG